jgi:thymidylate synthase
MENQEENQYLELVSKILREGAEETGRNGDTKSVFGASMRFSLRDGQIPLLTTKKVAWKTCFRELQFFIRGQTDSRILEKQGIHIWSLNSSREFLDERGLDYEEGMLGPIYGYQWRYYGAPYDKNTGGPLTNGIDQLQEIIDTLTDPDRRSSRRIVLTAWNPQQIDQMALPPCHVLAQFHVRENRYLSCALYQRSGDVGLGVAFNLASYSFLTHILAKHCNLEAEEFVYFLGNAHIYSPHIPELTKQIERTPYLFPKLRIKTQHESIEHYEIADIEWIEPYVSHSSIHMALL